MSKIQALLGYWFRGVRIYIAIATVVISLVVWWWGTAVYGSSQLRVIRVQETFAWLSLTYLFLALMIGPVAKTFKKLPGKPIIWDSRRALGISAAWFATLHVTIVYIIQFQAINPVDLPERYKIPVLIGVIALFGLLVMTATSVNAIMRRWGVWWFRVHRVVYLVVLLGLIHAFMIGAHATNGPVLIGLSAAAAVWLICTMAVLFRSKDATIFKAVGLSLGSVALVLTLCYGLFQNVNQAATEQHHLQSTEHTGH